MGREAEVCIRGEGMERCLPVKSIALRDSGIVLSIAKWITISFLAILGIIVTLSVVAAEFGLVIEAALVLTGLVMLYPASIFVAMMIGYAVYQGLGSRDVSSNTIILIFVLVGLGVGIYFLWFGWLNIEVAAVWGTI